MANSACIDPVKAAAAGARLLSDNPMFKVGEAEIRGNSYRVFENAPRCLSALLRDAAARHGEREFLVYEDERIGFAELWRRSCRFANALRDQLGVKQGDRVALAMRNFPEWCVTYIAVISIGAVIVPLNAWWKEEELHHGLKDCGAKIVVVDAKRLEYIATKKAELGLTIVLAREAGGGGDYNFDQLLAKARSETEPAANINPDDDFSIIYTSGSTGLAKGVVLTHRGVISALYSWSFLAEVVRDLDGGVAVENPSVLLSIPLFHVTGSHAIFLHSFMIGRRVVMMYRWHPQAAAALINREKLTSFIGVPTQSFELLQAAGVDGLPGLLDIGAGGAKRPADHVKRLATRFPNASPSSGYGLSETNALGCVISRGDYLLRPDSTGRPVPPLTDIKIMADERQMPAGTVGEIWIRGAANFRGYNNLPRETARTLTSDGWLRTGDLGFLDEDGYLYIVDRLKDVIIRGGENISSLEVENRVYAHRDVAEAVVFSVPDEVMGERVGLVVRLTEDSPIEPRSIRNFIAQGLADFKVPERIWVSPVNLPRLGTGKFDKIAIRKSALQHPPTLSA